MKKKVLFVGSFKKSGKDGSVGGQMFASTTLINSQISESVEWCLIDSTADSNISNSTLKRIIKAAKRLIKFTYHCIFSRIDTCLIFTADGLSFVEKGLMALIASILGKRTILAPRSGLVVNDLKNSVFMRWYIPFVLDTCELVVCQGKSWQVFYRNLLKKNKSKCVAIQNWIDGEEYFKMPKYEDDKANIFFLSWVDKNKGILDLIHAIHKLKAQYPKIQVNIAGDGKAMDESVHLVNDLKLSENVVFHGWVHGEEKMNLLSQATIYVLPSYFEGFPNSLMEAMASGLAVVTTKVGSIPDLVKHNQNGLLFDAGDVQSLYECLLDLVSDSDKRIKLANEGRTTIRKNNTTNIAIAKFAQILEV